MKKLHSLAFYALVAPVITLSSATLFAQTSTDQDVEREQQSTQPDRDGKHSRTTQGDREHMGKSDSRTGAHHQNMRDQSRQLSRGYMSTAPANGRQASDLIGAEVQTSADEKVGSVSDLIIDENGQVVAIVVGVGGFLGMGEKDVAIGWNDVTTSGPSDDQELRIDATREELNSAPEFEGQD